MQASLKKSLYLGLAALGFVAVAGATNATTANAAAAKEVSKTTIEHMNVNVTGKNAMYTRPGTLKGAKLVASTTTLNDLKDSNKGQKNWMAYQTVTTDRGSIYYKIVSFDKKYRGYVYAGSTKDNPKGGLVKFDTMKNVTETLSDSNKPTTDNPSFKFAKPGKENDNKTVTYKAPAWTEMGVGRVITDSTPYADDTLVITKQGDRTREGDQWVYVEDETNSSVSGWILRSGLTGNTATPAKDGVTVNYVDVNGNKTVKSIVVPFKDNDTANDSKMNMTMDTTTNNNLPDGYGFSVKSNGSAWADDAAAKAATAGSSLTVFVAKNDTVNMTADSGYGIVKGSLDQKIEYLKTAVDEKGNAIKGLNTVKVSGTEGVKVTASELTDAVTAAKLNTIYVPTAEGAKTYYKYTFNAEETLSLVAKDLKYKANGVFNLGYDQQAGTYKLDESTTNNGMVEA